MGGWNHSGERPEEGPKNHRQQAQQQAEVVAGGGEHGPKITPPAVVPAPTMAGP
jgi:hypothetical protein